MFDKEKLGHSFAPFSFTIERGKVHELAAAIGDENAIYHDRAAAEAAGYADVPLFPTTPTLFSFWGNKQLWEQMAEVGIYLRYVLHGEEEYEYLAPITPGDTLNGITTIVNCKSRRNRDGSTMEILTIETRYTNQHEQHVLTARTVFIHNEPAAVRE